VIKSNNDIATTTTQRSKKKKTNESLKTGQHLRQHANMQIDALTIFKRIKYAVLAENRMASAAKSS